MTTPVRALVTPASLAVILRLRQKVPQDMARRIVHAIEEAYAAARAEALKDEEGFAVETFTALLPRYVNRYLYGLSGLQRDSVQRRIARNSTGTNSYLYMKIGDLNITPAKTRTVNAQPSPTVYRRLLQQAAAPELIDAGQPLRPLADDLHCVIHSGYSLKNGLPFGPDFVRLSAFDASGRHYAGHLDLVDIAMSRRQREQMAVMTPLFPLPTPLPEEVPAETLVKPRRRRGEGPTEREGKKSS
jgi:hypothetical protein